MIVELLPGVFFEFGEDEAMKDLSRWNSDVEAPRNRWLIAGTPADFPYPCRCNRTPCTWERCPCRGRVDTLDIPMSCCAFVATEEIK
jgi:hypothetical protein